jgi:hypothetical protein
MKRTKRYDEGGDIGIPAQTEEEAANEAAMNSPVARARRNVSDAENQIRADAIAKLANKVAPAVEANEESSAPVAKMPMRPGQVSSGAKMPMVTKEQLAASGLSLRDYLNKQQGLTRRDESSAPASKSTRMPMRPGQESPTYSNEGRGKLAAYETPYDRMNRENRAAGKDFDSLTRNMFKGTRRGGGEYAKGGEVKKMASGGSVSSASKRADGIAQRGKTKGKMC